MVFTEAEMIPESVKTELKIRLKPQRYLHCVSVAQTAAALAAKYGANERKAYLAGILHDCAKNHTDSELFSLAAEYGIELDEVCKKSPGLLHAFVGAQEARRIYGVCDLEIYDAIYRHTIGGADMPILSEIIYLADGIEPLRSYEGVDEIRRAARESLHRAVVMYTDATVEYVIKRGLLLHPAAVETRNFYLGKY